YKDNYVRFHEDISGKNINFLIGSGTSFPFIKTLSLGRNKPSLEELLTNGNIKINAKYLVFYYYYHNWIVKMFMENEETSEYRQVFQNYEKFIKNGLNILRTEGYQNPKRMNIFTTNYDLFFENVFDSLVLENPLNFFNDGSRGFIDKYINIENYHLNVAHSGVQDNYKKEIPSFNLVKLHGSVSWQNTLQGIKVEYNEESILEKHQDLKIYIDKIEEIINNQNSEEEMINSINMLSEEINEQALLDFYAEYKKLAIINPTKYKFSQTVFEQHYYQMLRFLSYELERKNTILIVVGFSFADEHIKEIVGRSLSNPYLKIYIVCYDLHQRYKIEKLFSGFIDNKIEILPKIEAVFVSISDLEDMSIMFENSDQEQIKEYKLDPIEDYRIYKLPLWDKYNILSGSEDEEDVEIIAKNINAFEISNYYIEDNEEEKHFFEVSYLKGDICYLNSLIGFEMSDSDGEQDE
ncbi:TPA: hypothetical protein IP924_001455, partial [Listeria monocytogenes]|nr:hypothetical protein [Listeria monocytogenes]